MTEKQFMEAVLDAARSFAWMAYHTFDSRRSTAGFPDLILCKPPNPVLCDYNASAIDLTHATFNWYQDLDVGNPTAFSIP